MVPAKNLQIRLNAFSWSVIPQKHFIRSSVNEIGIIVLGGR